ncbi:hypothetical protein ACSBR2_025928 [Camellia fascicularis]
MNENCLIKWASIKLGLDFELVLVWIEPRLVLVHTLDWTLSITCLSHRSISVIGRRKEIEDALRVKLGLLSRYSRDFDFFGVYDGHGGSRVAQACRDRLHRLLVKEFEEEKEDGVEMTLLD